MSQNLLTKFEILRPGFGDFIPGVLPSSPVAIGQFMAISDVNPNTNERTFALATGQCDGVMVRNSRAGDGLTDKELLLGIPDTDGDGEIATPYPTSGQGTIQPLPLEAIYEGADCIDIAGGDAILAASAVNAELTIKAGKLALAASTDLVLYKIRKQLTVTDTTVTALAQVRIQIYKVVGYIKA